MPTSGRGSSGIRDAGRLVYTLVPMSEDEAKRLQHRSRGAHSYIRLDPAKVNIAARQANAEWFRIVGQADRQCHPANIPTATPSRSSNRGAARNVGRPRQRMLNQILTAIDAGLGDGNFYTDTNAKTDRAAWRVVQSFAPAKEREPMPGGHQGVAQNRAAGAVRLYQPKDTEGVKGLKVINSKRPSSNCDDGPKSIVASSSQAVCDDDDGALRINHRRRGRRRWIYPALERHRRIVAL